MFPVRTSLLARATVSQRAALSTSAIRSKTVVDTAKETLDTVNKKVGQTLAAGIEKTEQLTADAKSTAGPELETDAASAKQQLNQSAASVVGKARDVKDEAADVADQATRNL